MIGTLSFAWPWVFLLFPLPLLMLYRTSSAASHAISIPPRLESALNAIDGPQSANQWFNRFLPWICWTLLLIAIAQPSLTGNAVAQTASGRAITLAIDLSGSMERDDFTLNGQASDRLSVVKQVAGQFIENQKGNRLGLVLFAEEAFVASPLSYDTRAVKSYLDSAGIGMAGRSTAIGDALGLAIQTLRNDPATEKAIVLLSDGTNNAGTVEPESAALLAKELSISIHTIAMASDVKADGYDTSPSADLDEATLQSIADESSGAFFRARNTDDLQAIYTDIQTLALAETKAPDILLQHDLRNLILLILLVIVLGWEAVMWARAP